MSSHSVFDTVVLNADDYHGLRADVKRCLGKSSHGNLLACTFLARPVK